MIHQPRPVTARCQPQANTWPSVVEAGQWSRCGACPVAGPLRLTLFCPCTTGGLQREPATDRSRASVAAASFCRRGSSVLRKDQRSIHTCSLSVSLFGLAESARLSLSHRESVHSPSRLAPHAPDTVADGPRRGLGSGPVQEYLGGKMSVGTRSGGPAELVSWPV